jgi:hypothetical protein
MSPLSRKANPSPKNSRPCAMSAAECGSWANTKEGAPNWRLPASTRDKPRRRALGFFMGREQPS